MEFLESQHNIFELSNIRWSKLEEKLELFLSQISKDSKITKEAFFIILEEKEAKLILALSILCQGYLTEHNQLEGLDTIQDDNIQQKLEQFKDPEYEKKTVQPSWWLTPFTKLLAEDFKNKIKAECLRKNDTDSLINEIDPLINAIFGNEDIKEEDVNKAYNAINTYLSSKP